MVDRPQLSGRKGIVRGNAAVLAAHRRGHLAGDFAADDVATGEDVRHVRAQGNQTFPAGSLKVWLWFAETYARQLNVSSRPARWKVSWIPCARTTSLVLSIPKCFLVNIEYGPAGTCPASHAVTLA